VVKYDLHHHQALGGQAQPDVAKLLGSVLVTTHLRICTFILLQPYVIASICSNYSAHGESLSNRTGVPLTAILILT
jgi:hypothetical protein